MNKWLARGMLLVGALSLTVVVRSARAAAPAAVAGAAPSSSRNETPLGNLVADAVRQIAKAPIALIPAGLLEDKPLPANAGTPDAVRPVLSAPTEAVVTVTTTGKQLQEALERSVLLAPRKNQGFLQVSGLTFAFNPKAPEGSRVSEVKVGGEALKADKEYVVAMPESLAKGSLGYFKFWNAKDAKPVNNDKGAKVTLLDAVLARLKSGKGPGAIEDRIKSRA